MTAWAIFAVIVAALIASDLCVRAPPSFRPALLRTAGYVAVACGFGAWVWASRGHDDGLKFFTAYVLELSLSLDNIFVISLIFSALAIPPALRQRVLLIGVLSAMVLRALFIGLGVALVGRFDLALLLCGLFLIYTGVKAFFADEDKAVDLETNRAFRLLRRLVPVTTELHGERFFVRRLSWLDRPRLVATPLFVALVLVEIADLVFAADSVPATLAVTTDPFLVYTSNIFAILGLRSLYVVLEALVNRFEYVGKAVAVVLVFVGAKVFLAHPIPGVPMSAVEIPNALSLAVVLALLAGGMALSLWKARRHAA